MIARTLAVVFEVCTVLGAILGGFLLWSGMLPGNSAIQTGASSATAVAMAALPYMVAGVFHRFATRDIMAEQLKYADAMYQPE